MSLLAQIPVEFLTMSTAGVGGFIMKLKALDNERRQEERLHTLEAFKVGMAASTTSADAAGKRVSDSWGKLTRRMIALILITAVVLFPLIMAFFAPPTVVQTVKESGGWLWGLFPASSKQVFTSLDGYFYSPAVLTGFGHVVAFYFGQAAAKP